MCCVFSVTCIALTVTVTACDDGATAPSDTTRSSPQSRDRDVRVRPAPRVANAAAFELVASSQGAVLIWAGGPCTDGVHVQRFASDGSPVGQPAHLPGCGESRGADAQIVQVTAAAEGGRLGLAWIVRDDSRAEVFGSFGADSGDLFSPTLLLGAAARTVTSERGQLSLAGAESGQMRVSWRATDGRCSTGQASCARVVSDAHPPAESAAARGKDIREVPVPCPQLLVGALWRRGVWYESFCALEGPDARPMTEVYAIRPEIYYAEAFAVLAGCTPLGIAPAARGVVVMGMCTEGLTIHALGESHREVIANAVRDVRCDAGRPTLMIHNRQGQSLAYKLEAPTDRIEPWISDTLAVSGSRVAFTGRRLLVATVHNASLEVRAWKCQGESLVSDSPVML